jgi:hypothetical protein
MTITITGTQVQFPSNGNMEGFYTGSNKTNTSFPIGTILFTVGFGGVCSAVYLNTSGAATIAINCFCQFGFQYPSSGSLSLSGTWVCRGYGYGCGFPFIQRIA